MTSRAGIEARLSKRTTLSGDYTFQWLKFDDSGVPSPPSRPSSAAATRMAPSPRSITSSGRALTVGGEYEMRHATVDQVREFDVQNALGTVDWRIDRAPHALRRRRILLAGHQSRPATRAARLRFASA